MTRIGLGLAAAALALAGCDDDHKAQRVTVTTSDDGKTTTTTTSGGTEIGGGKVKVNVPGFKLDVDVPKSLVSGADFQMGGGKLFPGSKVDSVDVNKPDGGKGEPRVRLGFVSPAEPAIVRAYMVDGFAKKGHPLSGQGMTLTGTTEEGKPFTLALAPEGSGQTRGTFDITGDKGGDWSGK